MTNYEMEAMAQHHPKFKTHKNPPIEDRISKLENKRGKGGGDDVGYLSDVSMKSMTKVKEKEKEKEKERFLLLSLSLFSLSLSPSLS